MQLRDNSNPHHGNPYDSYGNENSWQKLSAVLFGGVLPSTAGFKLKVRFIWDRTIITGEMIGICIW